MFCSKCGKELPEGVAFCSGCGVRERKSHWTGWIVFGAVIAKGTREGYQKEKSQRAWYRDYCGSGGGSGCCSRADSIF